MLVSMKEILADAVKGNYAVGGFNCASLESAMGAIRASEELGIPFVLQHAPAHEKYIPLAVAGPIMIQLARAAKTPVAVHLDHGDSIEVCLRALAMGFTSVMMDGSLMSDGKTIASYDYNVEVTKRVVENAHCIGVSVEGELGCLGSLETMKGDKEDGHGTDAKMTRDQLVTDPDQAAEFVRATQLDALAIAIGTSHGAYKFTRRPTGEILSITRVKEIHERLPNTHLVMHGSSSVPQEYLAEIREFGGDMRETYGVPVEEIQEAIKHGVRKVNIDAGIRLAMTAAVRRYLVENPSGFDPRAYLKKAREEAYKLCKSPSRCPFLCCCSPSAQNVRSFFLSLCLSCFYMAQNCP